MKGRYYEKQQKQVDFNIEKRCIAIVKTGKYTQYSKHDVEDNMYNLENYRC